MALHVPPVANETDAIAAFLSQAQDAVRTLLHGPAPRRAASAPSASSLSVGGLVRHVTAVQCTRLDSWKAAPRDHVRDSCGGYRGAVVIDPSGNSSGTLQRHVVPTTGVPRTEEAVA